jgi:hypothetical protein
MSLAATEACDPASMAEYKFVEGPNTEIEHEHNFLAEDG